MAVKQQETACWVLPAEPEGQHFDEPDEGRERLPSPCLLAVCDGRPGEPCGEYLGNDEFAWLHFDSPDDARECAPTEGWRITADGVVTCPQDLEEEADAT